MKVTVQDLRAQLESLGLQPTGNRKRLIKKLKRGINPIPNVDDPLYLYLCLDVEATCDENSGFSFPNEIIEFPILLLSQDGSELDRFHSFVKPTQSPILSDFCKSLTGIDQVFRLSMLNDQDQIDTAPEFTQVLDSFETWLCQYAPRPFTNVRFVTDGPWDIRDFMRKQCIFSDIQRPPYLRRYIDLRKAFVEFYSKPRCSLSGMLQELGMQFEGRQHSGLDDTINVARIWKRMLMDGYTPHTTK